MEDVRECLTKTDLRPVLTRNLKSVLEVKLLRVGVNTADILTAYIAAIRALRVLDPSGVLLELVCEPVSRYLRSREDTVRCIVSRYGHPQFRQFHFVIITFSDTYLEKIVSIFGFQFS